MYPNNKHKLKDKRRDLRKNPTRAESILWLNLRRNQLGVKFRRQFSVENFIMDFYCHELKLAIEVDGYSHESDEAKLKDARRQKFLEGHGIRFLRYSDEEVLSNIDKVVENIKKHLKTFNPSLPSP